MHRADHAGCLNIGGNEDSSRPLATGEKLPSRLASARAGVLCSDNGTPMESRVGKRIHPANFTRMGYFRWLITNDETDGFMSMLNQVLHARPRTCTVVDSERQCVRNAEVAPKSDERRVRGAKSRGALVGDARKKNDSIDLSGGKAPQELHLARATGV